MAEELLNIEPEMTTGDGPGPKDNRQGQTDIVQDKTPKYDVNGRYMATQINTHTEKLVDLVSSTYSLMGTTPIFNGKPITSQEELLRLAANPKASQQLYGDAIKIFGNPAFLDEQYDAPLVSLYGKLKGVDDVLGLINHNREIFGKDMLFAAQTVDSKIKAGPEKGKYGSHTDLITKDGSWLSKTEWVTNQVNKAIEGLNDQLMGSKIRNYQPTPGDNILKMIKGQPSLNYGVQSNTIIPTNLPGSKMGHPTSADGMRQADQMLSQANYIKPATKQTVKNNPYYETFAKQYDDYKRRIVEEYNKNSRTNNLYSLSQGMMNSNAGGGTSTAANVIYNFNLSDDGRFTKNHKTGKLEVNPDLMQVLNFVNGLKDVSDAVYSIGGIGDEVPSESNEDARRIISMFRDKSINMLRTNSTKNLGAVPVGSLEVQAIAGGDKNMQAFHIKLQPEYYKEYKGTENEPGPGADDNMKEQGITIYVPKKSAISANIAISKDIDKMSRPSYVEGLMALDKDKQYTNVINGGMQYTVKRNLSTGGYSVTGNAVVYNPERATYDTIPLNKANIQTEYSTGTDIDKVVNEINDAALWLFIENRKTQRKHLASAGVKDPNKLRGN